MKSIVFLFEVLTIYEHTDKQPARMLPTPTHDDVQKTTPQDFWIPRIDAIVTVLKEAGRMQRKGIIR